MMKLQDFDFNLPQELVAKHPLKKREEAKLLYHDKFSQNIQDKQIIDLPGLLKSGDMLVFNETKVIKARLFCTLNISARGEVLLHKLQEEIGNQIIWKAFAKPLKKFHVGNRITFGNGFSADIIAKQMGEGLELAFDKANFHQKLAEFGSIPLPPYIKRQAKPTDEQDYQTIFAKGGNSVAAPTAGLHFTNDLMAQLAKKNIEKTFVNLTIGAGTFLPVKTEDVNQHKMHYEEFQIPTEAASAINRAKQEGRRVIAIGTTSLRSLESAVDEKGMLSAKTGKTNLFITPGYKFKIIDGLLTNFHLPKSTLFMLISALTGLQKAQEIYEYAIKNRYRFFSFGDACLFL